MSTDLDYNFLEKIILLVWDEPANFNSPKTQQKLVPNLFQEVILIENVDKLTSSLNSGGDDQEFLFIIHLFHNEDKRGVDLFVNSKARKIYPNLRPYVITSAPKLVAYSKEGTEDLDIYTYDGFHKKIGTTFIPQKKKEIIGANQTVSADFSKKGIFLSHSSKDRQVVEKFRDLILESGLNCDSKDIKFTSVEDHGIPGGIDIPENLRNFMKNEMALFIQFISKSYIESRVCLNEEGAAWCLLDDINFVSILLPPSEHDDISWVKDHNKAIKCSNKGSLTNLYQNRRTFFDAQVDVTRLTTKVDEFMEFYMLKYPL
jgi:hypothetical protein